MPRNKDRWNAYQREYQAKRRREDQDWAERQRERNRKNYATLTPEQVERKRLQSSEAHAKWRASGKYAAWARRAYATRIHHRLRINVGNSINQYLKRTKKPGSRKSTRDLIGYEIKGLIVHLESLFEPGMSWENYGRSKGCWSIDHIKPQSSFDFRSADEVRKCWALRNLRPMWHHLNQAKGKR